MNRNGWLLIVGSFLVVGAGSIIAFVVPDEDVQRIATAANVMLVGGLVLVTTAYAWSTNKIAIATNDQAEASLQMAEEAKKQAEASVNAIEEMREQRRDTFLPIIDIIRDESDTTHLMAIALRVENGEMFNELKCKLKNVGVGPALRMQYQVKWVDGETHTITEGNLSQGDLLTPPAALVVLPPLDENGSPYIHVNYSDVLGRICTSIKPIHVDFAEKRYELGNLNFDIQNAL